MTNRAWTDLARALAQLASHAAAARNDNTRRVHLERILGVDLAARAICRTLRASSTRFDGRRFMRLATGNLQRSKVLR